MKKLEGGRDDLKFFSKASLLSVGLGISPFLRPSLWIPLFNILYKLAKQQEAHA